MSSIHACIFKDKKKKGGGQGWKYPIMSHQSVEIIIRNKKMIAFLSQNISKVEGPQGATLGLLKYQSQSNQSADCVDVKDRFKSVDDLSILEIVNLITVGITSTFSTN